MRDQRDGQTGLRRMLEDEWQSKNEIDRARQKDWSYQELQGDSLTSGLWPLTHREEKRGGWDMSCPKVIPLVLPCHHLFLFFLILCRACWRMIVSHVARGGMLGSVCNRAPVTPSVLPEKMSSSPLHSTASWGGLQLWWFTQRASENTFFWPCYKTGMKECLSLTRYLIMRGKGGEEFPRNRCYLTHFWRVEIWMYWHIRSSFS